MFASRVWNRTRFWKKLFETSKILPDLLAKLVFQKNNTVFDFCSTIFKWFYSQPYYAIKTLHEFSKGREVRKNSREFEVEVQFCVHSMNFNLESSSVKTNNFFHANAKILDLMPTLSSCLLTCILDTYNGIVTSCTTIILESKQMER